MKFNSDILRRLRLVATVILAACFTMLAGSCMTDKQPEVKVRQAAQDRGYKFDHALHIAGGMEDCTVCHDTSSESGAALSMPGHDLCSVCHEIPASNTTPPEDPVERAKCSFCHTREDYTVTPWKSLLTEELKWQHAPHVQAEIACTTCHTNLDQRALPATPAKPFCMDCHQQTRPELNACSVCHSQLSMDAIPQFRSGERIAHDSPDIWLKVHGRESRISPTYCAMCHETQNRCEDCHSVMPPENHTTSFKHRTHGMLSAWDRNTCSACHEEQFCVKCHKETQPVSHRAGWGEHRNTHCVNCHYPEQRSGCAVCHENIEHESAMASPHALGLFPSNCSECHPGGLPHQAPHLLNSTVHCAVCHQ